MNNKHTFFIYLTKLATYRNILIQQKQQRKKQKKIDNYILSYDCIVYFIELMNSL